MARKRSNADLSEADRRNLTDLANYLETAARRADFPEAAERLGWACSSVRAFLNDKATTLDHAFGIVRRRGNPGGAVKSAARAAEFDKKGLTDAQILEECPDQDPRGLIRSVIRGRRANQATFDKAVTQGAIQKLQQESEQRRKQLSDKRKRAVRAFNKKHKVRMGSRRED